MVAALVQFENGGTATSAPAASPGDTSAAFAGKYTAPRAPSSSNKERLNELKLFTTRTIRHGRLPHHPDRPDHPPYSAFLPNGGHSLGYMDVKICELHELLQSIETGEAAWPSFNDGLVIEQVMDAVDKSSLSGQWVDVEATDNG